MTKQPTWPRSRTLSGRGAASEAEGALMVYCDDVGYRSHPSSVRQWSTDEVDRTARLDYWNGAVCEAFMEMQCTSKTAASFHGTLRSVPIGTIVVNQIRSSAQDVMRARGCSSQMPPFFLISQPRSAWQLRQGGRSFRLRAGDAVLLDAAAAYELRFPETGDCVSLQLPRSWVGKWLSKLDGCSPRIIERDRGWGRTLSGVLMQMGEDNDPGGGMPDPLLSDNLGAMLAACLEPSPTTRAEEQLVSSIILHIKSNLGDAGLSVALLAAQFGLSSRSMHRLFLATGLSVTQTIRRIRMDHAAYLLRQRRLQNLSVAEIGRRAGYLDPSHFIRDYKREFGTTPGRWRRLC